MSKGTARRAVRIEGGLWEAAKTKAETDGKNLSGVIRDALIAYVKDDSANAQTWDEVAAFIRSDMVIAQRLYLAERIRQNNSYRSEP